jgi:predicted secreted protein
MLWNATMLTDRRGATITPPLYPPEPAMPRVTSLSLLLPALALAHPALAEEAPRYNHVRFQVESSRAVDNDRMQAVLAVTAEDDNAARLADEVNRTMDWAVQIAKARPRIEVRSGGYRTQPVYDKGKIRRWRATQELVLEGGEFAQLGTLIGQLQERLQVSAVGFSVSPARRAGAEDELIAQAIDAFKQRAELVRKQFGAKGYRLVEVSIGAGDARPVPMMMRAGAEDAGFSSVTKFAAPLPVEAGTSTVKVTVAGAVVLQ